MSRDETPIIPKHIKFKNLPTQVECCTAKMRTVFVLNDSVVRLNIIHVLVEYYKETSTPTNENLATYQSVLCKATA